MQQMNNREIPAIAVEGLVRTQLWKNYSLEMILMPVPYSDDLRYKALDALDRGERKSEVCRMLKISRNTLDLWIERHKTSGLVGAIREYRRGPQPKIEDLENFQAFAQTHGHLTQAQMAQQWPEAISSRTLGKALQRIGFTRKKRLTATKSAMKHSDKRS